MCYRLATCGFTGRLPLPGKLCVGSAIQWEAEVKGSFEFHTAYSLMDTHKGPIGEAVELWGPKAVAAVLRALADMIEGGEIPVATRH